MKKPSPFLGVLSGLLLTVSAAVTRSAEQAHPEATDSAANDWFIADDSPAVPQVGLGELLFLATPPHSNTPLSQNRITITESSLRDGWVQLDQCHQGLDPVPATEIVYRYHAMRGLQIVSTGNIGTAVAAQHSVQLSDVRHDATLCIRAEVRILYDQPDGRRVLRNGPFQRKFLDGYFPLHVTLEVQYPSTALHYLGTSPEPQAGFAVDVGDGLLNIDSWFAGALTVEISFGADPQGSESER